MTLTELLALMRKNLKIVIALPVICALATALISTIFLANQYTATVSVYALAKNEGAETSASTQYTDLTAGQLLANDIAALAKSSSVQDKAAAALNMTSFNGYKIAVNSSTTTRLIDISVTSPNAESSALVANQIAAELSGVAQSTMGVQSVNVVDSADVPTSPSGPPRTMYTLVAFLAGLFVAIAILVLRDMIDTRVRTPEQAEELLGVPVIGRIPTIKA